MPGLLDIKTSIDDFKDLREDCINYYADKTSLIKKIVKPGDKSFDSYLILRPRRFGKSLNQSMLRYFFDIKEADNKRLFEDLEIAKDKEYCEKYQNKFPVLFLTFKDLDGESLEDMLTSMNDNLSEEFLRHQDAIDFLDNNVEKERFKRLYTATASFADFKQSIYLYSKALYKQYQQKVIILIDEYDVPLSYAYNNNYFKDYIGCFKSMLHKSLKSNKYLKGAVVTGCLQIAKNQLFTGLNNLKINTVSNCDDINTAYGFTKEEVRQMLDYYGMQDKMPIIEDWYDGYRFNNVEIYNPYSVNNFVDGLIKTANKIPQNYWANTSGNVLLKKMLFSCTDKPTLKEKFDTLINELPISTDYSTTVTYDDMLENEAAIFGTLLFSGYLTLDENNKLYIPNKEVLANFEKLVNDFNNKIAKDVTFNIMESFIEKDVDTITNRLRYVLVKTLSIIDLASDKEYAYHMILTGMLGVNQSKEWVILSNHESGEGFPDLILVNDLKRKAIIIELKVAKDRQEIEAKLDEAQKQINMKIYGENYTIDEYEVTNYAICFCKKNAKVRLCG